MLSRRLEVDRIDEIQAHVVGDTLDTLALYRRAGFTEIPAYGEYSLSSGTSACLAKVL